MSLEVAPLGQPCRGGDVSVSSVRVFAMIMLVAVVTPVGGALARTSSTPTPTVVPEDVRAALADLSIGVASATAVNTASLTVGYRRAFRIAEHKAGWMIRAYGHGWTRVDRLTIHLVRIVPPLFGEPDHHAFVSISPLLIGDLAWLIVMRDATIPILGPPGGTYIAPIAVFVRTDVPKFVVATTL
jgi:hypothetical protein